MRTDSPSDDELIDSIYSSLLGETSWQCFVDRLTRLLPGGRATMFFHDADRQFGNLSLASGFDPASVRAYDAHFSKVNPWMAKAGVRPVGVGVVAEQMLPREGLIATEFYSDFMRSLDTESAVGVTILREGRCSFLLSILTASGDADANMRTARTLSALAPHLRRAFEHYRRGAAAQAQHDVVGSVFEALGIGVLMVGMNGVVSFASAKAQTLVEQGIGIRVSHTGRLSATDAKAAALIDAMTNVALATPRIADTIMSGSDGANATRATFIRIGREGIRALFEGPAVVVLLEPAIERSPATGVERVANMHQLTAAEHRVLDGLTAGLTVQEIADRSELSRETIRNQLKSIFSKVGVSRQVDLVRLAVQFAPRIDAPR